MKPRSLFVLGVILLSVPAAGPAEAHFKLEAPAEWIQTNATGDPQKTSPCGSNAGTASNLVTKVKAGSKLHIKLSETIPHGGHYRVALAANRADLKDPVPVVTNNNCVSVPIESTPTLPVLADGLFPHVAGSVQSGKIWETDVTVPDTPCPSCTLQIIQFMTPHAPGCFYYHCANLEIVAADAGDVPDDGGTVVVDTGTSTSSSSGGSSSGSDDPGTDPVGDGTSGGTTTSGSSRRLSSSGSETESGCNVGWRSSPGFALVAFGLAGVMLARHRRRRSR